VSLKYLLDTTAVGNMRSSSATVRTALFVTRDADDIATKLRRLRDDPALRARYDVPRPACARYTARMFSMWRRKSPARWSEIHGWFQWRSGQEEAVRHFPDGSRFVEVGNFLGRSLCSLGELVQQSGKRISVIGVDTCRGSGIEGPKQKDYHARAVAKGGGTFAGTLHRNVIGCGLAGTVSLIVSDSVTAASFFADRSIAWAHLDARHDREHLVADIRAWLPKVQRGGWLSGDDYDPEKWPEVIATIDETLPGAALWSVKQWRLLIE